MRRFSVLLLLLLFLFIGVRSNSSVSSTTTNTPAAVAVAISASGSLDGESGASSSSSSFRPPEVEASSNRRAASLLIGRHSPHMPRLMNGDGLRFRRYIDFYFSGADDGNRRSRGRKPDRPVYVSVNVPPKTASNEWTSDQDMIAYPADEDQEEEEEEEESPTPSLNGAQTMRRSGRRGKQRWPSSRFRFVSGAAATETTSGGGARLQERVKYEDVRPRDGRYYEKGDNDDDDDSFDYPDRIAEQRRHRPAFVEGEFTSSELASSSSSSNAHEIQTSTTTMTMQTRNVEEEEVVTIVFDNVNRTYSTLRPPLNVGQTPPVLFIHELNGPDGDDHIDTTTINNNLRGENYHGDSTVKSTDDCDGELCKCFTSISYVLGLSWMGYMLEDYRMLLMSLVVLTLFFANCTLLVCAVKLFRRHRDRGVAVAHDWDVEEDDAAAATVVRLSTTDLKRAIGELSGYRKKRLSCLMYGRLKHNVQLLERYFYGIGPSRLTSMDFPLLLADLEPNLHLRRIKRLSDTATTADDRSKHDDDDSVDRRRHLDETGGDDRHRIDLTDGLQRFLYPRPPRLGAGGHDDEQEPDFDDDDDDDSPTAPLLQTPKAGRCEKDVA